MGVCGNYDYDLIEFYRLNDLDRGQLYRAEIDSIDRANNTAEITLLDTCTLPEGTDLTAVPFFYHCEGSTGTAAELVNGHLAFSVADWVYAIYVPAVGTEDPRFYIIGHVDIKDTTRCFLGPLASGDDTTSGRVRWEVKLGECADQDPIFIPETPRHLLNVRYINPNGAVASLIVFEAEVDSVWHVLVDSGGFTQFYETYTPSADSLHVSAALSEDFSTVYVAESRMSGLHRVCNWYRYVYNTGTDVWDLDDSDTVAEPSGVTFYSTRAFSVDRDGKLAGYWSIDLDTRTEQVLSPNGPCPNLALTSNPDGSLTGSASSYTRNYRSFDAINGGYWDISSTGSYVSGNDRTGLHVISEGDMYPVIEELLTTGERLTNDGTYNWSVWLLGFEGEWLREQIAYIAEETEYAVVINGTTTDIESYDDGLHYELLADSVAYTRLELVNPPPHQVHDTLDITFSTYMYRDGFRDISVTAGGWITSYYSAIERTAALDPIHTQTTTDYTGSWGNNKCYDFLLELDNANGITEDDVEEFTIEYPVNLGSYYAIDRSFSAHDQISGDTYVGIMFRATDVADSEWHIYINGVLSTQDVEDCIGRPIEQLGGIYWSSR